MVKLTWGQTAVLVVTSVPMAAAGIAGGIASYFNFAGVPGMRQSNALSLVLAGEAVAVICALVALAVTLMGQHTPAAARAGLWLAPLAASVAGAVIAPDVNTKVAMSLSPLAMTAAGEGIALVARRIVAYRTGTDIEQQRRSGLLLWHANRAANGGWFGRRVSRVAVWRLTRQFAETDSQMSVQLGEVQRYRIAEGADANLAAALAGKAGNAPKNPVSKPETVSLAPAPAPLPELPEAPSAAVTAALTASPAPVLKPNEFIDQPSGEVYEILPVPAPTDDDDGFGFVKGVLAEAEQTVYADTSVKLMTGAEVAALKGVNGATVRSWVARGHLPVTAKDGARNLFHPADVAKLD